MSEIVSGVYQIVKKTNGKRYVGSSKNISKRWNDHIRDLLSNNHHSVVLQRAWNKYGSTSFEFLVIETCQSEALVCLEQHYIDTLLPEYNILKKANSLLGYHHTEETKRLLAKASTGNKNCVGRKASAESRHKMSLAKIGTRRSQETKDRIGYASRNISAETRLKLSVAHRNPSLETRNKLSASTSAYWARIRLEKEKENESN